MDASETRPKRPPVSELSLYYLLVGAYFFAFGMQMVLFPSLVTFILAEPPARVGLAQMALSAPMFCLLLFGGLVAERAQAGPTLALLQVGFALAALGLAGVVATGALSYSLLILYAVTVGMFAAFMLPVRDAALNGVVGRDAIGGREVQIANAAAATTAVQIGAQILGIVAARFAGATPAPYLALQSLVLGLGAGLALLLRAPKPSGHEHTLSGALRDLKAGLAYSFKNPVMAPMLISAAFVGVFMIGAFQVLFPLIVRDAYGGTAAQQAGRLGELLAAFWTASFVSAATLSRMKPIYRAGRALIVAHLIGAVILLTFATHKPFWLFMVLVTIWGLAAGVAISVSRTITQSAADPQFLGRVLAVYSMGFMGGAPIGSALVGLAAEQMGPRLASLIPGIGLGGAILLLVLFTPMWRLDLSTVAHDWGDAPAKPPGAGSPSA